jgi:glycerophosphoryl diester phosphodiesterase
LAAVRECVEAGVPRLEIDVRFLTDDTMVIFHDSELQHETTGHGRVDALDASAARAIRYTRHPDTELCFLEEIVEEMRGSDTILQVDLKLMRPMSPRRTERIVEALRSIDEHVLIGSQAHWNVRNLRERGFRIALDPTLHWHFAVARPMEMTPRRLGVHGLWDDAPLAHILHATAEEYVSSRVTDLVEMVPGVAEWMVDIATIRHLGTLGCNLGDVLGERGIELAAWTLRDRGEAETGDVLREMLEHGATTIIADDPTVIAGYAATVDPVNGL